MTITRDMAVQRFVGTIVALAMALVGMGCAASETPRADAPGSQQSKAAEVDLTGAHLDKRKFLLGVSMLGKSVEQDIELLRKMTGHTFEPKEMGHRMSDGSKPFTETASFFKVSPMLISGTYTYTVAPDGAVNSYIRFVFNTKIDCISVADLESVYGKPTRIETGPESFPPGRGPGGFAPSDLKNVIYDFSTGGHAVFVAYASGPCVSNAVRTSVRTLRRS